MDRARLTCAHFGTALASTHSLRSIGCGAWTLTTSRTPATDRPVRGSEFESDRRAFQSEMHPRRPIPEQHGVGHVAAWTDWSVMVMAQAVWRTAAMLYSDRVRQRQPGDTAIDSAVT